MVSKSYCYDFKMAGRVKNTQIRGGNNGIIEPFTVGLFLGECVTDQTNGAPDAERPT